MTIRVPFRIGPLFREKDIDFIFNIGALEYATEVILGCDLWEAEKQDQYDVSIAVLYAAYITACKSRYKKPKYGLGHAAVWVDNMSKVSQETYIKAMKELTGKMTGKKETEKKK